MYPALYASRSFLPSEQIHIDILNHRYESLEDAIEFAKQTRVALREQNWYVFKCSSCIFGKKRISLRSLYDANLLSKEISQDEISIYYNWK